MTDSDFELMIVKMSEEPHPADDSSEFDRLMKEIEELREQQAKIARDLDQSLQFYYDKIYPEERALITALVERIKIFYEFYESQNGFSPEELQIFKKLILSEIAPLLSLGGASGDEVRAIYKKLIGVEPPKKEEPKPPEPERGDPSARKGYQGRRRETRKETHHSENKKMKKKSLNSIYKRLAKASHPDLEQDPERKIEKGEMMKRITAAYEKGDLHELLAIEAELKAQSAELIEPESEEDLAVYNSILKEQIETLRNSLNEVILGAKYNPIQRYYRNSTTGKYTMMVEYEKLLGSVKGQQAFLERLHTEEAESLLKELLRLVSQGH